jgi:lipopolysaccharide export system permease protein
MRLVRALDRYVFGEFFRIFLVTALGFPVLVIVIDMVENLNKYLERKLPLADVAMSYVYWLPDSMFNVLPAAVLFATVFAIGTVTRHSEITAAKASGISFYRFIVPIFFGATLAAALGLALGELAPAWNAKRNALLQENKQTGKRQRYNFVFAAEHGRVYKATALDADSGVLTQVEIERVGTGPEYPSTLLASPRAHWAPDRRGWVLDSGALHVIATDSASITFQFDSLLDRRLVERPRDLLTSAKAPTDMNYSELGRFILSMERSGVNADALRVDRMLKIAIPVTCVIILLFGAPLATSTQRGGTAYGIGLSLGTTVIFLILIQLTRAIGGNGIIRPELAAWIPSMVFGVVGLVLLARVRT